MAKLQCLCGSNGDKGIAFYAVVHWLVLVGPTLGIAYLSELLLLAAAVAADAGFPSAKCRCGLFTSVACWLSSPCCDSVNLPLPCAAFCASKACCIIPSRLPVPLGSCEQRFQHVWVAA